MFRRPRRPWGPHDAMKRARRRSLAVGLLAVLAACDSGRETTGPAAGGDDLGQAVPVLFASPIPAAPGNTVFYGAYVDQSGAGSRLDYACGAKTYDGHQGTDLLLKNFAVQDAGVGVVAAAAGRVVHVEDGFGDRSTTAGFGGFGNHVVVEHGPLLVTVYAHLRRGSVAVAVGDDVSGGQTLGLVGSSGSSNWPHLHFEVRDGGHAVDPFAGPCNAAQGRWLAQVGYQDSVRVLDGDVTIDDVSSLRALLERPASVDTIRGDETTVTVWIQLLNAPRSMVRFEVLDPSGRLEVLSERQFAGTFSIWYITLTLPAAGSLTADGGWTVKFFLADRWMWTGGFHVARPATVAPPSEGDRGAAPTMRVWNPRPGARAGVGLRD